MSRLSAPASSRLPAPSALSTDLTVSDPDVILDALVYSEGCEAIRCQAEIRKILKEAVNRCYDDAHLRKVWGLWAAVGLKFYQRAMEGDGDPQSAIVLAKTSERRATLAGANMLQNHVLQVASTSPEAKSGTRQIREVLDNVLGITSGERELEDKKLYSDEKLTVDEQQELDQLCAAREAKPEAEQEPQRKQDPGPAETALAALLRHR